MFKKNTEMVSKTKRNGDVVIKNHPLAKKVVIINDPKMAAKHAKNLTVMIQPSQMKICGDKLKEFISTDVGKAILIGSGSAAVAGGIVASVMAVRRKIRLKKITQNILDNIIVLGDEKTVDEWLASAYAETCQNSLYLNLSDKEKIGVLNLIRRVVINGALHQESDDDDDDGLSIHDFDDFDWGCDDEDDAASAIAEDIKEINCGTAEPPILPTEDEVEDDSDDEEEAQETTIPSVTEKIKGKSQREKFEERWKTGNSKPDGMG